jgi:hypothetical protein
VLESRRIEVILRLAWSSFSLGHHNTPEDFENGIKKFDLVEPHHAGDDPASNAFTEQQHLLYQGAHEQGTKFQFG